MGNQLGCGSESLQTSPGGIDATLEVRDGACQVNVDKYKAYLERTCTHNRDRVDRTQRFAFVPNSQVCGPGTVWTGSHCELEE